MDQQAFPGGRGVITYARYLSIDNDKEITRTIKQILWRVEYTIQSLLSVKEHASRLKKTHSEMATTGTAGHPKKEQ